MIMHPHWKKKKASRLALEMVFSNEQKRRVLNLDESAVGFDGSVSGKGGRPPSIPTTKGVNRPSTGTHKNDASVTVIGAHNALGEALPLHVHFPSDASEENTRVNLSCILGMPKGFGRFGMNYVLSSWRCVELLTLCRKAFAILQEKKNMKEFGHYPYWA